METREKSSAILNKLLNNISHSDSIAPSSIALPVWLDGHHPKEATNKHNLNPASTFNLDSTKIDSYSSSGLLNASSGDIRSAPIGSPESSISSSSRISSSPLPILPTSPTSYWWRPHFTKLPSLKHNYDFTNTRNVDSSQASNINDKDNYPRTTSRWVIVIGSGVGVAIACIIICALFACTNFLFFPPRRKEQLPKC